MSTMPPLPDYDEMPPPFPDDWYGYVAEDNAFSPDAYIPDDYVPADMGFADFPPPEQDGLQGFDEPEPADEAWHWHDARFIGVDRGENAATGRYEIGGMDVYANHDTGDLGASYLPIAMFNKLDEAEQVYHDLQQQIHEAGLAAHNLYEFMEQQAFAYNPEPQNWRGAEAIEYIAYDHARSLNDLDNQLDMPPAEALDPLIATALELGGVIQPPEISHEAEQQALAAIGVNAPDFDSRQNPPPFYDEQTGTAYWIGVFQADAANKEDCVTSILSLGTDAESGELVAHLAPCVQGDWDKTYSAAEYLIAIAQKGGIEPCFDAAEGMALATEQRDLWHDERGVPLADEAAQSIAETARENWEVAL